ncbi:hypothetical protein ACFLQ6_06660 [Thermoproteota archaeon]
MAENILIKRKKRRLILSKPKNINAWIAAISSALLLMATIGSAFSVLQATLWTGQQAISYGQASAYRIESVRASNFAVAQIQVDAALFTDWISAISENNTELADFLEDRFREEFRPAFYAWLSKSETSADGVPLGTPFELPEYQLETMEESDIYLEKAEEEFKKGSEANSINDRYISTTVLFAIVLFFTGIEPRWQKAKLKIAMTIVAATIFIIAILLISQLPILWIY